MTRAISLGGLADLEVEPEPTWQPRPRGQSARSWRVRGLPARTRHYYKMARLLGLDWPFGRALYVVNRGQNMGLRGHGLDILSSAKTETAKRWQFHWLAGGHVKSLKRYRTNTSTFA